MSSIPWEGIVVLGLIVGFLMIISLVLWIFSRNSASRFPLKRVIVLVLCIAAIMVPYQIVDKFPSKMAAGYTQSNWNTSDKPFFVELRTPLYEQSKDEVYTAAVAAVQELGWDVVSQSKEEGKLFLSVSSMFGIYTDQLSIVILPDGARTRMDIQASSERVKSNLGVGRRQIVQFIRTVDQQFGIDRPTLR